ncbi:SurA N-terminal domain-containing protein [Alkalihalobacillus sp. 1P02AB]|uniref:SurA N-terminal domain-containing protein n=1 Tax=Alkalihalobacillus sp. 1P02AB TaxID=3132260 RepID=UPI0039A7734E
MYKKWKIGLFSLLTLLLLVACNSGNEEEANNSTGEEQEQMPQVELDTEDYPEIIATVNGEDILREEYVPFLENQAGMIVAFMGVDIETEEGQEELRNLEEIVADLFVNDKLIEQEIAAENFEVTEEEVDQRMESVILQHGSEEELEKTLEEYGFTMDELRSDIEVELKREQFLAEQINIEEVTEEELQQLYDSKIENGEEIGEFAEVRDNLEAEILNSRETEAIQNYLDTLKEKSEIEIHL